MQNLDERANLLIFSDASLKSSDSDWPMALATRAVIKEIIPRTRDVKSFRVVPEQFVDFKAGQWLFVKIEAAGKELSKPLSISSAPSEKNHLEFTKKITSSEFSCALTRLQPGDQVQIQYPFGNFIFQNDVPKIAFLSGGIGITPIHSICRDVTDRGWETDMVLLYGNNTSEDIAFRDDFEALTARNPHLKAVNVICKDCVDWRGRKGLITSVVIREEIPDYAERRFYVCGPPAMVEAMKSILLNELALPKQQVVTENFMGYA